MADKQADFDDKGMIRVFTYGTLKGGHGNHRLFETAKAKFMGYDSISGPFQMQDMVGFPGVFRPAALDASLTPITTEIKGEVWAMEPEGLSSVDLLEGHPHFYRREKMWTENGLRAWIFLLNPEFLKRRPSFLEGTRTIKHALWGASEEELKHWDLEAA